MLEWVQILLILLGVFIGIKISPYFLGGLAFIKKPIGQPARARKRIQPVASAAQPQVLIVGAGPAGIGSAGALNSLGIDNVVIEATDSIASSWRGHYKRLHLHTAHPFSGLPHLPIPNHYPRFISRQQVVDYVTGYASMMQVNTQLEETVLHISRNANDEWEVRTKPANAPEKIYNPKIVVVATGECTIPVIPSFVDQDKFKGTIVHSSKYSTAEEYRGKKVLVVGFGNTGGELTIDLWEHGCDVTALARSPVNVVARETIMLGVLARYLPYSLQITVERIMTKFRFGDLPKYGLTCPIPGRENACFYRLRDHHEAPVVDIGQIDLVRRSEIKVVSHEIERFTSTGVIFKNQKEEPFDAVILATGFKPNFPTFLSNDITQQVITKLGFPKACGEETPEVPDLFFVGFADQTGRILKIKEDAIRIADAIKKKF